MRMLPLPLLNGRAISFQAWPGLAGSGLVGSGRVGGVRDPGQAGAQAGRQPARGEQGRHPARSHQVPFVDVNAGSIHYRPPPCNPADAALQRQADRQPG